MPAKKLPAISFRRTDPHLKAPPSSGKLYACKRSRVDMFIANGSSQYIDCGFTMTLPAGVTVEVLPDEGWEQTGVRLVPRRIEGPVTDLPMEILCYNHAGGTIRFTNEEQLARIIAYQTPDAAPWLDESDQQAKMAELLAPDAPPPTEPGLENAQAAP